jgi:hypothetical protein
MKRILLTVFLGFGWTFGWTQRQYTTNTDAWLMYFGDHKVASRWGVHVEAQWRRNQLIVNPQQLLLRTGINYHFTANAFGTVGYCFVETYPYGEFAAKSTFPEHRLWQQIQFKSQMERLEVVSRIRLEQRFIHNPVQVSTSYKAGKAVYSNRFRMLYRASFPFKGKSIIDKSWYASIYNEVFVNFGKNVGLNIFDQNRAYIAIGYKYPRLGRIEVGLMDQIIVKADGKRIENNPTLQVGLTSNIDFYKPKS